jgi:hypothetical protein
MPETLKTVVRAASKSQVSASFLPDTLDLLKRTVTVVFATDAPVLMGYYERYYEILSFDGEACDFSLLNNGAPMLDTHNTWGGQQTSPVLLSVDTAKAARGMLLCVSPAMQVKMVSLTAPAKNSCKGLQKAWYEMYQSAIPLQSMKKLTQQVHNQWA